MPGEVINEHVVWAVFVTGSEVQLSFPVAVTMLLTEQEPRGAVKLAVKLELAPTGKVMGPMTGVLGAG